MARPQKADSAAVDTWLSRHLGWAREGDAIARTFEFPDFGGALARAVRIGLLAEKRDHHPDLHVGWGKLRVVWSTHDAGGITELDLELAARTDEL
jgi:4a-hydroxytetrahydrobiopterin dehydratase